MLHLSSGQTAPVICLKNGYISHGPGKNQVVILKSVIEEEFIEGVCSKVWARCREPWGSLLLSLDLEGWGEEQYWNLDVRVLCKGLCDGSCEHQLREVASVCWLPGKELGDKCLLSLLPLRHLISASHWPNLARSHSAKELCGKKAGIKMILEGQMEAISTEQWYLYPHQIIVGGHDEP